MSISKHRQPPCAKSCGAQVNVFLQPGEWFFGGRDACVRTTLGSCIAFTFWHRQRRIGGMCHYMLSHRAGAQENAADGRYADEALALLADAARSNGTHLRDYEVKLFGGADMFLLPDRRLTSVASCNIAIARQLVQEHGLRLAAENVGGSCYRQLIFAIATGDVWVRLGPSQPRPTTGITAVGARR